MQRPIPVVGALIFNKQGKLLLIKTHKWSHKYGLPGGKIDLKETAEHALKREAKEETNVNIFDISFLQIQNCINPKEYYKKDIHFLMLDFICKTKDTKVKLNYEAQSYVWVTPEIALSMNLNQPTRNSVSTYLQHQGKIILKNLTYSVIIGIFPKERKQKQEIKIDLEMLFDFKKIKKDTIKQTIDYDKVNKVIKQLLDKKKYKLIETAAKDIAKQLQNKFTLSKVKVTIKKPKAVKNASYVAAISHQ